MICVRVWWELLRAAQFTIILMQESRALFASPKAPSSSTVATPHAHLRSASSGLKMEIRCIGSVTQAVQKRPNSGLSIWYPRRNKIKKIAFQERDFVLCAVYLSGAQRIRGMPQVFFLCRQKSPPSDEGGLFLWS